MTIGRWFATRDIFGDLVGPALHRTAESPPVRRRLQRRPQFLRGRHSERVEYGAYSVNKFLKSLRLLIVGILVIHAEQPGRPPEFLAPLSDHFDDPFRPVQFSQPRLIFAKHA